jgi:predicted acylesterase/phospholipase RssA
MRTSRHKIMNELIEDKGHNNNLHRLQLLFLLLIVLACQGCSTTIIRNPVPEDLTSQVTVLDKDDLRFIPFEINEEFIVPYTLTMMQQQTDSKLLYEDNGNTKPSYILALSGGGEGGAFGAGILNGWTVTGTRPEFTVVTGISTGALIAPFAFLGSDYDWVLKELYTETTAKQLIKKNGIFSIFRLDALFDTEPLRKLIAEYITADTLQKISQEHLKGRRLFIGTTNLDTLRTVIWDMGAIASSNHSDAPELFRKVMLASASIPGAYPAVYINVQAEGKQYDEMHVDGGTSSQVFVYPPEFKLKELAKQHNYNRERNLYVIFNSKLKPKGQVFKPGLRTIARRSISTLINTQGQGDIFRIYLTSQRDKVNFNMAFIPSVMEKESTEEFDTDYMQELYDYGYKQMIDGYQWKQTLPGFE